MPKTLTMLLAGLWLLCASAFAAAADVNHATRAELESIKGIGPTVAGHMLDEREKAPFKSWHDLIARIKGLGERNAATLSAAGLTVDGASFERVTPAAKPTAKAKKVAEQAASTATK